MLRKIFIICISVFICFQLFGQSLSLSDESDMTIENKTYDNLSINNCTNITIRNCNFSHNSGSVANIKKSSNIVLENCIINGEANACTGLNMSGSSFITIQGCEIFNIADDGISIQSSQNVSFLRNKVHQLIAKGTDGVIDGPCYNGHSDGFEINNCSNILLDGNLVYDVKSTSCLFLGNWGDKVTNLTLQNNIFYCPDASFVLYIHYVNGVNMYNNVFWKGRYGGLALGKDIYNLNAYNNIMHSVNLNHAALSYDPDNHHFDYNIIAQVNQGMPLQEHDIFTTDPGFSGIPPITDPQTFVDITAEQFTLLPNSPAVDAAFVDDNTPTIDLMEQERNDYVDIFNSGVGLHSFFDMGAIEFYGETGQIARRPEISQSPGTYNEPISCELTTQTDGAEIYYTLDGSVPTNKSVLYDGPFEIRADLTVRAIAVKAGIYDSQILSADYSFTKDLVPPYVKSIIVQDKNTIVVNFNEKLETSSATNVSNYTIDGITISSVEIADNLSSITLKTSDLESDNSYSIDISNIKDMADEPLTIESVSMDFVFSLAIFDDFEDGGKLNWEPKTPDRWSLHQDGDRYSYHLNTTSYKENGDMPGEYSILSGYTFKNFVLEITARQPEFNSSGNAFADWGFIIGYTDDQNYYYFLVNKNTGSNELFQVTNGTRTSLLNLGTSLLEDDKYHKLTIEVYDGMFILTPEGKDEGWEIELEIPEGKVGLCSYNDEAYFDHFKITPIADKAELSNSTQVSVIQGKENIISEIKGTDIFIPQGTTVSNFVASIQVDNGKGTFKLLTSLSNSAQPGDDEEMTEAMIVYVVAENGQTKAFYKIKFGEGQVSGMDRAKVEEINIYPNPAKNDFSIEIPENIYVKSIFFIDLLGHKTKYIINKEQHFIQMSVNNSGIYIVQFITDSNIIQKRLIIN